MTLESIMWSALLSFLGVLFGAMVSLVFAKIQHRRQVAFALYERTMDFYRKTDSLLWSASKRYHEVTIPRTVPVFSTAQKTRDSLIAHQTRLSHVMLLVPASLPKKARWDTLDALFRIWSLLGSCAEAVTFQDDAGLPDYQWMCKGELERVLETLHYHHEVAVRAMRKAARVSSPEEVLKIEKSRLQ